ncbi:NADH-quinone oxidoreductase subunit NuoF [Marinobacter sp. NP-4(2019)]|uniref:formate dehydrogenase beta subunit n=1 Tax=Marinobacter sp. NP-4(2019) TaxID=2488665 RepID=UPI000FC3D955|nr:NADH-quinone oxidoreductase subunit NuoF [Marinobacter sp. NP-4(2019)]AZT83841.1 NADH-quinone oxidoreductase subunit NuoF [Marinobacter sp. NP-4(2019)]
MVKVFVPRDTTALSLGANQVAEALEQAESGQGTGIQLIRNGSRGLFWLEPLVEVETDQGRVAYGPVAPEDIPDLLDQGLLEGKPGHPLYQGLTEEIPYLKNQQRLTFRRAGVIDPTSLDDYVHQGGYVGLRKALARIPQEIIDEVKASGLRGRGGAAFPAGIKWQTVLDADARSPNSPYSNRKFIVCNADEGDSGTFADRLVMEADPFMLIEGMTIAGLAVGADTGFIYLRSEYPVAHKILNEAIATAEEAGYLGNDVLKSGKAFHLEVRLGAGAYICGEETSLLDSLEGKRGQVRVKPPLPALKGAFGQPTVVNNVLTLAAVPFILAEGGQAYADYGMGRSRGTLPFQLTGNIERGGVVELAFGITLRELLEDYGGGTASGRPMRAVQVGGPLGAYMPESQWDTPLDYEAFSEVGAVVGHGGIVVFDDTVDMLEQARFAMEFCAVESCGKCTPCRIGSTRGVEVIDRIHANEQRDDNLILLEELCDTLEDGSLCAMGGMTPNPVRSALQHFPDDFHQDRPTAYRTTAGEA